MTTSLRLTLFGGFCVSDTAGRKIHVAGTKATLLLSYLALHAEKAQAREKLMGLLWSQRSESQARGSLRQALWALRRAFETAGSYPLVIEGDMVALDPATVDVDVLDFENFLATGSPDALQSALALYSGELLEGVRVQDPAFEEFLRSERLRFYGMAVDASSKLLDYQLQNGMDRSAATTAKRLLTIDPLQEVAHRTLMRHYADRGQMGLACKQYEICCEILQRELQVTPDARTQRLFSRIRDTRPDTTERTSARHAGKTGQQRRSGAIGQRSPEEPSSPVSTPDAAMASDAGYPCFRCQHQNPEGHKFCGKCGKPLAVDCPGCGATNRVGQNYCGNCGTRLSEPPAPRISPPDDYTPKHLAERILTSQGVLDGERKHVTVLFADLKGSMELVAGRDPEEASKVLDPILETMIKAVHCYEGTVNKVLSDGIMALFGVPLTHEDHAVRACYAALAMRDGVRRMVAKASDSDGLGTEVRVGLNSGDVVVRAIGNDLSMDYDAIGPTTLLAGRMEQLAAAGTIRLTQDTLRLAEGFIRVKPLDTVAVEGLEHSIQSYELVSAVPMQTRLRAGAGRGLTPFAGRQGELASLRRALQQARSGQGQVVGVLGEPGMGKTRLFYEFAYAHRRQPWVFLETYSESYGQGSAYVPVIGLLKTYFQIDASDDALKIREKVIDKLLALDSTLESILPAVLSLLDVAFEDSHWQALEPRQRRQYMLDGIKRLLIRESQEQPVCLVFENLHWIDSESQALLDSLVDSLPTARILLLVNYRPEYQHAWGSKTYYTQLRLDPLSVESAEELLEAMLGSDDDIRLLKRILIERTEGNPFFLEESIRTLIDIQVLVGERGAYRLHKPVSSIQVPASVQAVIAARIDRLPAEDKRLLQCAAVIGKDVPYDLIEAIADLPENDLRNSLAHLQAAEFLHETTLFPNLEYTFKHALTYDVAYGSLLHERRCGLHAQIVDAIERLYGDRLAEQAARLAYHALRGEQWDRAHGYLRQLGAKAAARSAYREAATSLEQALVALHHLPETRETLQQGIDIRFDLRSALQALSDHERVFEHLNDAEKLATALEDQVRLGWASAYLSQYLWRFGDPNRAEELGRRALTVASGRTEFALEVVTNFFLGQGYFNVGDFQRAIDHCKRNLVVLEGDRAHERLGLTGLPSVLTRIWLAWSLAERGDFSEATLYGQEAISIAEVANQPYSLAAACLGMGQVQLIRGDLGQSITVLNRAAELCEKRDLHVILPTICSVLGLSYMLCGRVEEAMPMLEEGEAQAAQVRIFDTATAATALSTGYLLAGKIDEADKAASRVASLAAERGFRGSQAKVSQLLGEINARRDPPQMTQSEEHFQRALALAEELGMRPVAAHTHLGLGRLYRCVGERQKSAEHVGAALTMYRGMDMNFWLGEAEGLA
jgi:class 3 adenylate cyclase/DNA-binding SARP family transcriptional activator